MEQTGDVERFIQAAIDKDLSLDKMQALLAMREQFRKEVARAAYDRAMSEFQSECPIIVKDKEVRNKPEKGGGVRYRYAPLDSIVSQVRRLLAKNNFRYMVNTEINDKGYIVATVNVMHTAGHTEQSSFSVPIDKDAFMNEQQKLAAAMTYAKRYAFCNAFGILTGDEDTDATTEEEEKHKTTQKEEPLPENNGTVDGYVKEVTQQATKSNPKYTIILESGMKYSTFDRTFAEIAKQAKEAGKILTIKFKDTKYGKEIILLTTGIA